MIAGGLSPSGWVALPSHLGRCLGGLFLAIVLAAGGRAQESPVAGTLPEDYLPGLRPLLDAAMKQSPDMIENDMKIAIANAQKLENGISPMLPHLASNVYYGNFESSVSADSAAHDHNTGVFGAIALNQSLFEWGTLKNTLATNKVAELIAQKNFADAYRGFVAGLRNQYLALVLAKMNLRNTQFNLKITRKALDLATERLKNGVIPKDALVDPTLQYEQAQLGADRTEQGYISQRKTFARQLGMKDLDDAAIPTEIPEPKFPAEVADGLLAALLRDGARGTYQAQISELAVRQKDLQYRIAKVRLLPQLSAMAGITEQNQTTAFATSVSQEALTTEYYQVTASWNMFDGLATSGAKREALLGKQIAQRNYEKVTEDLMIQAQDAKRDVEFAWRALTISDQQFVRAGYGFKEEEQEFGLHNISQDAMDQAQSTYHNNEYFHSAARVDFLNSWMDFVSKVGADPVLLNLPARYARVQP